MIKHFTELCQRRHSIRSFSSEPISDSSLREILELVQTAPSAGNLQAYQVIVVRDQRRRRELAAAAWGQAFVAQADVVLAFLALPVVSAQRYGVRGTRLYAIQDATIACTYAMLAATALDLATTWVGAFNDQKVGRILGLTDDQVPVALLPIGHSNEIPDPTGRKPLSLMVREM